MDRQFIVFKPTRYGAADLTYACARIEKETDKRVSLAAVAGAHARFIHPSQIVARFDNAGDAAVLLQSINGVRGAYVDVERRARARAQANITELIERATK